jgi:predicted transposase/invertase (TIGR01784 family)
MLGRNRALSDYSAFTAKVREGLAGGLPIGEAIKEAIRHCEKYGIMKSYLESHGSGVRNMLITEWNFELEKKISNEEAREDGFAIGEAKGKAEGKAEGISKGKVAVARNLRTLGVDAEVISKASGLSVDEILQL